MWNSDPVMLPFKTAPGLQKRRWATPGRRTSGRRGVEQVRRHGHVRPVREGKMKPEDSVKWASAELAKIYT
jgi:hypothetical protein